MRFPVGNILIDWRGWSLVRPNGQLYAVDSLPQHPNGIVLAFEGLPESRAPRWVRIAEVFGNESWDYKLGAGNSVLLRPHFARISSVILAENRQVLYAGVVDLRRPKGRVVIRAGGADTVRTVGGGLPTVRQQDFDWKKTLPRWGILPHAPWDLTHLGRLMAPGRQVSPRSVRT